MTGMTVEEMEFLAAKGLSISDIIEFAKLARQPKPRSANAERQARYRQRRKGGCDATETVTQDVTRNAERNVTPPNDIYSNPPVISPSAKADCPSLADRVVDAWNSGPKAKGATGAAAMDANRRKHLSLRVREHGEAAVFEAIGNVASSPFHCGANDRGWRANLGWMLKSPENFLKCLEMGQTVRPINPVSDLVEQARRYAVRKDAA